MTVPSGETCARMKKDLASFRFLEEADLPLLEPYFECRQAAAGEILWREGERCDYLVFLTEGQVDIKKQTEFEGKQVIVGVYGRGSIVGGLCLLDDTSRAVTAVVLEDAAFLLLTRDKFEHLLANHPAVGVRLLKGMLLAASIRLRKSYDRLASIF